MKETKVRLIPFFNSNVYNIENSQNTVAECMNEGNFNILLARKSLCEVLLLKELVQNPEDHEVLIVS